MKRTLRTLTALLISLALVLSLSACSKIGQIVDNLKDKASSAEETKETKSQPETKEPSAEPTESKAPETEQAQPSETQPAETKAPETEPAETKPAESVPAETKEPETAPPETKEPETTPLPSSDLPGYYKLTDMPSEGGPEAIAMMEAMGMKVFLVIEEGGTGYGHMMGEEYDLAWDESTITIYGDAAAYTLEEDVLSIMNEGVIYMVLTRSSEPAPERGSTVAGPTKPEPVLSDTPEGYYKLTDMSGEDAASMLALMEAMGLKAYVVLEEGGTAFLHLFGSEADLTWDESSLKHDDETIPYTLENGILSFEADGSTLFFTRLGDPSEAPERETEPEDPEQPTDPVFPIVSGDVPGYYVLTGAEGDDLDTEELEAFLQSGYSCFLVLEEGGTGFLHFPEQAELELTWDETSVAHNGEPIPYTLEDGVLTLAEGDEKLIFTRRGDVSDGPARGEVRDPIAGMTRLGEITLTETVLAETDEFAFIVTGITPPEDKWDYYQVYFRLVNKTSDKRLTFDGDFCMVNGVYDGSSIYETVEPGASSDEKIYFDPEDLTDYGIGDPTVISLFLLVRDRNDWDNVYFKDTVSLYPLGEEKAELFVPDGTGKVIFDNDLVRLTMASLDYDDYWEEFTAVIMVENKTDKRLYIDFDDIKLNGAAFEPYMDTYTGPYGFAFEDGDFSLSKLTEAGIDVNKSVEVSFTLTVEDESGDYGKDILKETVTFRT